jgi:predicted Zn-ribbon and HTH transcriptional regulator
MVNKMVAKKEYVIHFRNGGIDVELKDIKNKPKEKGVQGIKCKKCGYIIKSHTNKPTTCPNCRRRLTPI